MTRIEKYKNIHTQLTHEKVKHYHDLESVFDYKRLSAIFDEKLAICKYYSNVIKGNYKHHKHHEE